MPYRVLLTQDAVNDLEELDTWIATHDSPERADYVLDRISEVFQELAELPERGTYPKELSALGIREFREVFFKESDVGFAAVFVGRERNPLYRL